MSRNAFAELERDYNEREDRLAEHRETIAAFDAQMAHDRALQQQEAGTVRWICVYCGHEVPEEHSSCCGEVGHTEPIPPEDEQ